jgi:glucose/arabinose dehydrogenase
MRRPSVRLFSGAVVAVASITCFATRASAQKPPTRTLESVTGYTSTPAKLPFDSATVNRLKVPSGFRVTVFSSKVGAPRILAVGDDGTVFATRRDSNDVVSFSYGADGRAGPMTRVVGNLAHVHGIALHDGKIYLATVAEVYEAALDSSGKAGALHAIITDLPDGGQHPNRTLGFGPDGMLYISVGSTCNQCVEPNEENGTILRAKPDGSAREVYALGLRNTLGFGWDPATGLMWGMDNGYDWKGDDVPPEELNQLQGASNYGWPFCYGSKTPDKTFASDPPGSSKEEFCPLTVAPTLTTTAHSAPMQLAFYTGTMFPQEYRHDAFVALRGSWNRKVISGYRVVRVQFQNGKPTAIQDFLTGFLSPAGDSYVGRPVGVAVAKDGALLVGDDTNGVIYRVTYVGNAGGAK